MRWHKFLPANAAGGIVWAGIYTAVSYLAGTWLQHASRTIDWILGGVAVVTIAALVVLVRRQGSRLAERAEEAYPGPLDGPSRLEAASSVRRGGQDDDAGHGRPDSPLGH